MRLTLVLTALLLFTGTASAAQGPWIHPAKPLPGSPALRATGPEVAVGPGRTATAVWVDRANNGTEEVTDDQWRVRATTRPAFGRFGRPVVLFAFPAHRNRLYGPAIVAGSAGTLVSWISNEGNEESVQYRFRPKGKKFGPVRSLSHGGNPGSLIAARGSDGTMALAWSADDGIQAAIRLPRTGFSETFDFAVDGIFAIPFDIAVGSNRDVFLTWETVGASTRALETGVIRKARQAGPARTLTLTLKGRTPRVAVHPGGRATFVWSQGRTSSILGRNLSLRGKFSDTFEVSQPGQPGHGDNQADIVIGGNGEVSVIYMTRRREYFGGDGYLAYSNLTVASWRPGERIRYRAMGKGSEHSARWPKIVASANGTTTVLWSRNGESGQEIHSSAHPPNGNFPRPSTRVAKGSTYNASLATSSDGTVVAVWSYRDESRVQLRTASTRP